MNRISIVGGSGTGKTTLALELSKIYNLPVVHIDGIAHKSNWETIAHGERDKLIIEAANANKWIIDGLYHKTLEYRFKRADLIIWLDYSTFAQLKGIFKRFITHPYKEKPDIPGCKERFNLKFYSYVFNFRRKKRHYIIENLENIDKSKLLIFKNRKELNRWLTDIRTK